MLNVITSWCSKCVVVEEKVSWWVSGYRDVVRCVVCDYGYRDVFRSSVVVVVLFVYGNRDVIRGAVCPCWRWQALF